MASIFHATHTKLWVRHLEIAPVDKPRIHATDASTQHTNIITTTQHETILSRKIWRASNTFKNYWRTKRSMACAIVSVILVAQRDSQPVCLVCEIFVSIRLCRATKLQIWVNWHEPTKYNYGWFYIGAWIQPLYTCATTQHTWPAEVDAYASLVKSSVPC